MEPKLGAVYEHKSYPGYTVRIGMLHLAAKTLTADILSHPHVKPENTWFRDIGGSFPVTGSSFDLFLTTWEEVANPNTQPPETFDECSKCHNPYPYGSGPKVCTECKLWAAVTG